MNIKTPVGDVNVNRKSGYPSYKLEVQYHDSDDWYSSTVSLSPLVDDRIDARSKITHSVIQEAIDAWFDEYGSDVDEIRAVEVIEKTTIRQTPYDERPEIS